MMANNRLARLKKIYLHVTLTKLDLRFVRRILFYFVRRMRLTDSSFHKSYILLLYLHALHYAVHVPVVSPLGHRVITISNGDDDGNDIDEMKDESNTTKPLLKKSREEKLNGDPETRLIQRLADKDAEGLEDALCELAKDHPKNHALMTEEIEVKKHRDILEGMNFVSL